MQRRRIEPGPGQESVWDYPRPPAIRAVDNTVRVETADGDPVAVTSAAIQVLETSHPPGWYLPPDAVVDGRLRRSDARSTVCEWKGRATYWDLVEPDGTVVPEVGWSYEEPIPPFAAIRGYVTFYPERVGRCLVDGEPVQPQPGAFYGGWVTPDVVGPFKGSPGTMSW